MNEDINFKETIRELLSQPAKDANGAKIQREGKDINWMEALCDQLIKKGFKDGSLGWKILQEAGVVSRPKNEQPQQTHDDYEQLLNRKKDDIRKLMKRQHLDDPSIEVSIELAARDWVAYEKACEDYASCALEPEDKIRLSEQMRKWSTTLKDVLADLVKTSSSKRSTISEEFYIE